MAQRNVHPDDLAYALAQGQGIWSGGGGQYVFLAQKDIPGHDRAGRRAKLEERWLSSRGTTAV